MDFVPAVKHALSNYAVFQGRASRSEFWWFELFLVIAYVIIAVLLAVLGAVLGDSGQIIGSLLYFVFALGVLLPALGVTIRRLHDVDKSGWWIFISVVPIIGPILLIIWYCTKGSLGDNRFGADPLRG